MPAMMDSLSISSSRHSCCGMVAMFLVQILFVIPCLGQSPAVLSLPLQGYYRPGRYMPVTISGTFAKAGSVTVSAVNMVPTCVPLSDGSIRATLPLLALRAPARGVTLSLADGSVHAFDVPLRDLSPTDRLVATTIGDPAPAVMFFPGCTLIPISLDAVDPLPGPAFAWESLDAIVLDSASFSRLSSSTIPALLAAGTAIIVQSALPPDAVWPWQHIESLWVLRHSPLGSAIFSDSVYAPAIGWSPSWPQFHRQWLILASVLFSVVILLLSLWRSNLTWPVVTLLGLFSIAGILYWRTHHSPLIQIDGTVLIVDPPFAQEDHWAYQTTFDPSTFVYRFNGLTHPIFASVAHAELVSPVLYCSPTGQPTYFLYNLTAQAKIAFLTRRAGLVPTSLASQIPITTPLAALATDFYASRSTGQLPATPWPTLVLQSATK